MKAGFCYAAERTVVRLAVRKVIAVFVQNEKGQFVSWTAYGSPRWA